MACSQTLSEGAGRCVLTDKEGPARERRRPSALESPCSDRSVWWYAVVGVRGRRAAVRVGPQTYGTGRASVVPVPRSYGAGLGALFVCCSLVVLVLFNICRLGDAVVSGPRKTRLFRRQVLSHGVILSTCGQEFLAQICG